MFRQGMVHQSLIQAVSQHRFSNFFATRSQANQPNVNKHLSSHIKGRDRKTVRPTSDDGKKLMRLPDGTFLHLQTHGRLRS
ncbi:hypothetical protein EJ08DRAFT_326285 [Tothia fuscella]|uniref:Uncharacterized protein n=1 Tax=Tothia fuscella TaxID=1048955 RepID=A0A9P4NN39_9PEZI|nr:hypothetical protein EJ08DRAFT_326285 [Tothia fuscella]